MISRFANHLWGKHDRGGVVLLFHRVIEVTSRTRGVGPRTAVAVDSFAKFIRQLHQRFDVVSLYEFANLVRHQHDCRGKAVVTFDDGFQDNASFAWPVLRGENLPWTLFVTTGMLDGDCQPYEYALASIINQVSGFEMEIDGCPSTWDTSDDAKKRLVYESVRTKLKPMSAKIRRESVASIVSTNPLHKPVIPQFLTMEELKTLDADSNVTIGGHTCNHLLLSAIDSESVRQEIFDDKSTLEQWLGHSIDHFAYPYGGFNEEVKRLTESAGYQTAVTTQGERVHRRTDPFAIPRFEVTSQNIQSLLLELDGGV